MPLHSGARALSSPQCFELNASQKAEPWLITCVTVIALSSGLSIFIFLWTCCRAKKCRNSGMRKKEENLSDFVPKEAEEDLDQFYVKAPPKMSVDFSRNSIFVSKSSLPKDPQIFQRYVSADFRNNSAADFVSTESAVNYQEKIHALSDFLFNPKSSELDKNRLSHEEIFEDNRASISMRRNESSLSVDHVIRKDGLFDGVFSKKKFSLIEEQPSLQDIFQTHKRKSRYFENFTEETVL